MDLGFLQKDALLIFEQMSGRRLRQELFHVADLIAAGKLNQTKRLLHHLLQARCNIFTEREVAAYEAAIDDPSQFYAEAMVMREAEAEFINETLTELMDNAEALAVSDRRYTRSDLALWIMVALVDIPQELQKRFELALADYDSTKTAT